MKAASSVPTGLLHLYRFKSLIAFHQQKNHPAGWFLLQKSNQTEQNRGKSKQKYTVYRNSIACIKRPIKVWSA